MNDVRELCQKWLDEQDAKKHRRELLVALHAAIEYFEQKVLKARKVFNSRTLDLSEIKGQIWDLLDDEDFELICANKRIPANFPYTTSLDADKNYYNYLVEAYNNAFAYLVECEEQLIDLKEQLEILKSEK